MKTIYEVSNLEMDERFCNSIDGDCIETFATSKETERYVKQLGKRCKEGNEKRFPERVYFLVVKYDGDYLIPEGQFYAYMSEYLRKEKNGKYVTVK